MQKLLSDIEEMNSNTRFYDSKNFCKALQSSATAQKKKFSIKNFFNKCDQIRRLYKIQE